MAKVSITEDCIGCGACAAIAPNVFEMDPSTMKSKVKKQPEGEEEMDLVKQSADACPVGAIKIK